MILTCPKKNKGGGITSVFPWGANPTKARKANDFMAKDGNARGNEVQKALALETRPLGVVSPL